jgi:hypothetical protein
VVAAYWPARELLLFWPTNLMLHVTRYKLQAL